MSQDPDVRIMDRQRRLDRAERRRARADGTNPRKAAACMKARAALQAKREAARLDRALGFPPGAADGGRAPQTGARPDGPLPPLSPRPDFPPDGPVSERVSESAGGISENSEISSGKSEVPKSGQVEKSARRSGPALVTAEQSRRRAGVRGEPEELVEDAARIGEDGRIHVDERAGAPPEFALNDRPGAVFKPPREPVVTRDKQGRMVVK